ncbi:type II secretion system protein M [Alteromonadaceae bacterium M269]|nr:type II secretion system protein M [Alteromonadaceae bacterium M269]
MEELKQKYAQLTEREQWLIKIIAIILIIGIFHSAVWSPLNAAVEKSEKSLKTQKTVLQTMKKNTQRALQLKSGGTQTASLRGSLAQAVNGTANSLSVTIARMQPQGEELIVWVDEAPFDSVLAWLQAMENRGVKIIDADFAETNQPGQIKVRRLQVGKS